MSRTVETHDDGSTTERYSDDSTITRNSDGEVLHTTEVTNSAAFDGIPVLELGGGYRDQVTTRDGDGRITDIQPLSK